METWSAETLAEMLGLWKRGPGPLARRLGRRLVELVDEGALPDGAVLPTERALAGRLDVSRFTTSGAYRYAKDAGRLDSRQGSASWVRAPHRARPNPVGVPGPVGAPARAFDALGREPDGVIDLSLAEIRCDAHSREVVEQLDPGWAASIVQGTGYHPQGMPALRGPLSDYLRERGHAVTAEDILVTTGAQQAIALTAAAYCPAGGTVLVEEASYPGALEVFRRRGARTLPIPVDGSGPDPAALADLLAGTRPAVVYLVPVANNPTGVVVPAQRLDALAEVLAGSGALVIEDRTAAPLAAPAAVPAPLVSRLPRGTGVVVGSMSKIVWAGLRVGWLLAPPAVLHEVLTARIAADLAGSAVSQMLAARFVPELPQLAATARLELAIAHHVLGGALARELPEWTGAEPDAGGWRWVRIPADARTFARVAAGCGVLVTPGPAFSPHALLPDRLRIAAVEPPEVLLEGVARLRRAWESMPRGSAPADDGRDLLII